MKKYIENRKNVTQIRMQLEKLQNLPRAKFLTEEDDIKKAIEERTDFVTDGHGMVVLLSNTFGKILIVWGNEGFDEEALIPTELVYFIDHVKKKDAPLMFFLVRMHKRFMRIIDFREAQPFVFS